MADAVFWQLLESVRDGLQDDLTFSTQTGDTIPAIKDTAIVIRKLPHRFDDRKNDKTEETPGIIISPVRAVRHPRAGTNERDDTVYTILLQFINRDHDDRVNNLKTYLKWHEQIAKYFQSSVRDDVQGDEGIVNIGHAITHTVANDSQYMLHHMFVSGMELEFISRETRGVTT